MRISRFKDINEVYRLISSLLLLLALPAHASQPLIACGHPDYPPFMWQKENKIIGAGPEIATTIFKELGVELISRYVGNWKRCQKEVRLGKVDVFVAAYKTKEREGYADYVPTYFATDPTAVFVWRDRTFEFNTWDDLIGKRIGTNLGGSMGEAFDTFILKHFEQHQVSTRLQNFRKLEAGRIDFHPIGLYSGLLEAAKHGYEGRIVPLKTPINTEYLFFAFSKKSSFKHLLPQVDFALKRMRRRGLIQPIVEHHRKQFSDILTTTK